MCTTVMAGCVCLKMCERLLSPCILEANGPQNPSRNRTMNCKFDPTVLKGQPIGMLHCPECGYMILAGVPHLDYSQIEELPTYDDEWKEPEEI